MTSLRRKGVNVSDRPVIHSQNEMTTLYGQSPLATTARQQTATLTWTTVHTYWSQLMYSRIGITCCLFGFYTFNTFNLAKKAGCRRDFYLNNFEPFDCTCFLLIHPSLRPPPSHVTFNLCVVVCVVFLCQKESAEATINTISSFTRATLLCWSILEGGMTTTTTTTTEIRPVLDELRIRLPAMEFSKRGWAV